MIRHLTTRTVRFGSRLMSTSYPKHELVNMPSLSPTMKVGTVSSWVKKAGDACAPGDTIAEIETDKASIAFECQDDYYIAKILIPEGKEVPCGSPIMISVENKDDISAFADYVLADVPVAAAAPVAQPATAAAPSTPKPVENPVEIPVEKPAVKPVSAPAAAASVAAPAVASSASIVGIYSVSPFASNNSHSPLTFKLSKEQQAYINKYGRSSHAALKTK